MCQRFFGSTGSEHFNAKSACTGMRLVSALTLSFGLLMATACAGCSHHASKSQAEKAAERAAPLPAKEGNGSLGCGVSSRLPKWVRIEHLPLRAVAGAKLFAESGSTTCHTYLGSGSSNLGAPDLTAEGAKRRGIQFQIRRLKCPTCVHRGSPEVIGAESYRTWLTVRIVRKAGRDALGTHASGISGRGRRTTRAASPRDSLRLLAPVAAVVVQRDSDRRQESVVAARLGRTWLPMEHVGPD